MAAKKAVKGRVRKTTGAAPSGDASPRAEAAFEALVAAFARDRRVEPPAPSRRAFGSNALKVDGKIFAMLVRGALVLKLPAPRVAAMIAAGRGAPFDAGRGRAMKEWVVARDAASDWLELAREARAFVGG